MVAKGVKGWGRGREENRHSPGGPNYPAKKDYQKRGSKSKEGVRRGGE